MDIYEIMELFKNSECLNNIIYINSDLYKTIKTVKEFFGYDILKEIIVIDKRNDDYELIYNLYSTANDEECRISITVKNEAESVADLFPSAKADENEIFDMFGLQFIGNDDLKRLYMPENWEGNPLRKDYVN